MRRNWPLVDTHARRDVGRAKPAGERGPAGRATVTSRSVFVVADVHPDVAPAARGHGRLPHIAFVVRVVARLIDVRNGEAEDRGAEAMVAPDMALPVVDAVEVHLRIRR